MRPIKFRAWNGRAMFEELEIVGPDIGLNTLLERTGKLYHLMQFTGLLDKNGKEIYEGDLVGIAYLGPELVEVKWDNFHQGWMPYMSAENTDWEIIGNIWEHPELLPNQ